jgi:NAD-dependent dihydropyrimidine dehydrogenase PreA subunit
MAVDASGMPIRTFITKGTEADCSNALQLIDGICSNGVIADRAYDTDAIITSAINNNSIPVIPSKSNRKIPRVHDKALYKLRHKRVPKIPKECMGCGLRVPKIPKECMGCGLRVPKIPKECMGDDR